MYDKFQLHPLIISENFFLNIFSIKHLLFMSPQLPIKLSDLDESHLKRGGLLKKLFSNISSETAEIVNFHFSHYKSMGTISCHSNQSSYLTGIKTQFM